MGRVCFQDCDAERRQGRKDFVGGVLDCSTVLRKILARLIEEQSLPVREVQW